MARPRLRPLFCFSPAISLALAACADPAPPVLIDPPRVALTCPDPSTRAQLTESSTYRDLAVSRQEAIHGWTICHRAVEFSSP